MTLTTQARVLETMRNARGTYTPKDYSQKLHVKEERILIASDVHIPYHDDYALAELLAAAEQYRVEAIVWLGDLMDMPNFSSWGNEDLNTLFETELEQVEALLTLASEYVPVQYWSRGNHEKRWLKWNKFQLGMRRLAYEAGVKGLMEQGKLFTSDNPTMTYGNDWWLTHPAQYGKTPLVVPGNLADKFGVNIASAHAHHWAQGVSPRRGFVVLETGGLFEPDRVQYIQENVTDHRFWTKGFVMLDHGVPSMFRAGR
jgi:predicted phosphodiesterase